MRRGGSDSSTGRTSQGPRWVRRALSRGTAGRVHLALDSASGRWLSLPAGSVSDAPQSSQTCMSPPPDTDWLRRHYREPDVQSGFGQSIDACVTTGTTRWGGIGFYGDEDGWGVGGLVKKDMTTGTFEYRRPYRLLDQSVSKLGYFADRLWLGTAHHGECVGPEPGNGLFLYDAGDFVREVPEVCGFAIRAMTVYDDSFWVASDLGLARGRRDSNGQVVWQNFVPDLADEQLMRPVTCDALYEELLRSPELATDTAFDRGFAFEEFWNELSSLRRDFVSRYLRRLHGHKPASE